MSTENLARLKEEAQMVDMDTLLRYIRVFSDLGSQLRYATQKRVLLEVALIKLCRPAMETRPDALLDRIRAVEKQLEEGMETLAANAQAGRGGGSLAADRPEPVREPAAKPRLPEALNEDVKAVAGDFRSFLNDMSPMLRTYLKQARLSAGEGNRLLIVLPDELSASAAGTEEHKKEIQQVIADKTGKMVEVEFRSLENGRRFEDQYVDLENLIHMEITVEDE